MSALLGTRRGANERWSGAGSMGGAGTVFFGLTMALLGCQEKTGTTSSARGSTSAPQTEGAASASRINGRWRLTDARPIVISLLSAGAGVWRFVNPEDQSVYSGPLRHRILDVLTVEHEGVDSKVVVASTTPAAMWFECHSCSPSLSLVEFRNVRNGWEPRAVRLNAYSGSEGGKPPAGIRSIPLGRREVGIEISDSYSGMGESFSGTELFALIEDKFEDVLSLQTGHIPSLDPDDPEIMWEAHYRTVPRAGERFYDIAVTREGPDGAPVETVSDSSGNPLGPHDLYRLDGRRYLAVR
jgi:hypothetical protein